MMSDLGIHKICKAVGVHHFYENKYGIKVHNRPKTNFSGVFMEQDLAPETISLGFDGLKDDYTLIKTSIPESPHFDLVFRINDGLSITDCDYVIREHQGSLDGRYGMNIKNHKQKFMDIKARILNDVYEPAIIYESKGRFYVYDGKHRLAMCYLLNKKCRCRIINVTEFLNDYYTNRLYKMIQTKSGYSKNISFLNEIL